MSSASIPATSAISSTPADRREVNPLTPTAATFDEPPVLTTDRRAMLRRRKRYGGSPGSLLPGARTFDRIWHGWH